MGDLGERNQMSAIAYLWTIEIEKHGADMGLAGFEIRMNRLARLA